MKEDSDILEIKFTGQGINPELVSLDELAKHLVGFDKLVHPIILQEAPDLNLEDAYVGLVDIGNRSLSFRFRIKQNQVEVKRAFVILMGAITALSVSNLPHETLTELDRISGFNRKYGTKTSMGEVQEGEFVEHCAFQDEYKKDKIPTIKGKTTVYGEIQTVGGEVPHLTVVTPAGDKVRVDVEKDEATKWNVYKCVRVEGIGSWKGKELTLKSIKAEKIEPFEGAGAVEGFEFLKLNLGKYWEGKNPEDYLND